MVTGADRGIVTAASYEAKALGIPRGMPIFRLRKLFPQVIVMPGDYDSYVRYSGMMFDIVRRYADDVEEYSIDECFADLTGLDRTYIGGRTTRMSYREIAFQIKKEINDELDLGVSVGVAPTKVLAKSASKWQKPNGFTMIHKNDAFEYLDKITIDKVWGIGGQTSAKLKKMGIQTAGDYARRDQVWIREHFAKPYETIWHELNGTSVNPVDPAPKLLYSSIQKTRTFHPATNDTGFLFAQLSRHTENACAKARRYGLLPKSASIFLKTRDFAYVRREFKLPFPTNSPETILAEVRRELPAIHVPGVLYRASGIVLRELIPKKALEKDLFGNVNTADKFEMIHEKIDQLENKYGKRMVHLASSHREEDGGKGTDANSIFP